MGPGGERVEVMEDWEGQGNEDVGEREAVEGKKVVGMAQLGEAED